MERQWIDSCFAAADVEEIFRRLQVSSDEKARAALDIMLKASPTSLKVALRNIRSAAAFTRVEESFQQDYRVALACIAGHDFIEGVRAAIIDKDRNPRWSPASLDLVSADAVEAHFAPLAEGELALGDGAT